MIYESKSSRDPKLNPTHIAQKNSKTHTLFSKMLLFLLFPLCLLCAVLPSISSVVEFFLFLDPLLCGNTYITSD